MKRYKKIKPLLAASFLLLFAACSSENKETSPTEPIFSDVEKIELLTPAHSDTQISAANANFTFKLPDEVRYIVLGLFSSPITIVDGLIQNSNWVAGTRTGLSDFNISQIPITTLHSFNSETGDFKIEKYSASSGTYYWAVWGFDSGMNLIAASPQWKFVLLP